MSTHVHQDGAEMGSRSESKTPAQRVESLTEMAWNLGSDEAMGQLDSTSEFESNKTELISYMEGLEEKLNHIQDKVNEQAEDEGIWCIAVYASEAYVQSCLRDLHRVIEGSKSLTDAPETKDKHWLDDNPEQYASLKKALKSINRRKIDEI